MAGIALHRICSTRTRTSETKTVLANAISPHRNHLRRNHRIPLPRRILHLPRHILHRHRHNYRLPIRNPPYQRLMPHNQNHNLQTSRHIPPC
jgi:hypothetical protein